MGDVLLDLGTVGGADPRVGARRVGPERDHRATGAGIVAVLIRDVLLEEGGERIGSPLDRPSRSD